VFFPFKEKILLFVVRSVFDILQMVFNALRPLKNHQPTK